MINMEQRISMITLGVSDLARSRRFYEQGLGWKASNRSNEQIVFFQVGGMVLALYPRAALAEDANLPNDGSGFGGISLSYNVRQHEEVDTMLAEAQAAGARLLKPAEEAHWGGYSGCFADPDGYPWEVAWNPYWEMCEDGSMKLPA
jgi:catechol 2,3-dioxygenase-like lactoylglutathione lyase family enzyme